MKQVIIPFGDIDEVCCHLCFFLSQMIYNVFGSEINYYFAIQIKRSQHAVINPAITIILRMGCGGHGVPPLGSPDGGL